MVVTLAISKVHQVQTFSCRGHSVGPPQAIEPLLDQFAISSQPWSTDLLIHRDILHADYQRRDRLFGLLSELGNGLCINPPILGVTVALSDLPIIIRLLFFLLGGIFNEVFNEV